jgi:hypothetical protein
MAGMLSLSLVDGFGRITRKRFEMTDQLLLADYINNANALIAALDTITDLEILRADIVMTEEATLPAKDPTGSNVDVGATFSGYVGDAEGKKASLKVPGIALSYVDPDGTIDVSNADVAAFLDLFGDPPDNKFKISDGEYIEDWITGTLDK